MDTDKLKTMKIVGFSVVSIMVVIIIIMIVITSLSFTCQWPFDTLLARCVSPVSITNNIPVCDKNSLCLDKCPDKQYRELTCKPCPRDTTFIDGKCVPICKDDEIDTYLGCVKKICPPGQLQIGADVCIPDITGYYVETDPTTQYVIGRYRFSQLSPANRNFEMEHKPTGYYLDHITGVLGGVSKGIRRTATQLNNDSIVWDDGVIWEKTYPYLKTPRYYLDGDPWIS